MPDPMVLDRRRMDELTAGLPSKSAKMRELANSGYKRADIARYLGVRYQFVYNVLSAAHHASNNQEQSNDAQGGNGESPEPDRDVGTAAAVKAKWIWATVGKDGLVGLPSAFLGALGVMEGDQVQLTLEKNTIRILNRTSALRELQKQVRRYVPENVSLVDELLIERRAEAARETKDG